MSTASMTADAELHTDAAESAADQGEGLMSRSFLAMNVTQSLGALNDNLFRWLIVGIGKAYYPDNQALIMTIGGLALCLPFMIFVAPAAYFSDRFSKRSVMIGVKIAEIVIMSGGVVAILTGNTVAMFIVMFLMGAQSAVFGPAKYGSIPEIVRKDLISKANGIVAMTTMVAVIVGTFVGNYLYTWTTVDPENPLASPLFGPGQYRLWISAVALIGVAAVGCFASFFVRRLPAADTSRRFPIDWVSQTVRDLRALFSRRPVMIVALGSVFYWSLAMLAQLNIDNFATNYLHLGQEYVGWLLASLVIGIGVGAVLAGWISKDHVELGLVPIGALMIVVFALALGCVGETTLPEGAKILSNPFTVSFFFAGLFLFLLGISAGLYDIPLLAAIQERSPRECRGQILAAYNFLSFAGMTIASGVYTLLGSKDTGLGLDASGIWLIASVITVPVWIGVTYYASLPLFKLFMRSLLRVLYRPRVIGLENVPKEGGVLLVGNHVSYADGALVGMAVRRNVRYFAHADYIRMPILHHLSVQAKTIEVLPGKKFMNSVRTAQAALAEGDIVCIFPEGGLTRTGQVAAFDPGYQTILKGAHKLAQGANGADTEDSEGAHAGNSPAPIVVIPFYLGGIWHSIFSYRNGKSFWKWPKRLPEPVTIAFGRPIVGIPEPSELRQIIMEIGVDVMRDPARSPETTSKWIAPPESVDDSKTGNGAPETA